MKTQNLGDQSPTHSKGTTILRFPKGTAVQLSTPAPSSSHCQDCGLKFGIFTHRHYCRMCAGVFCAKCLSNTKTTRNTKLCKTCRIPKFLQLEATSMKRIFSFLNVRSYIHVMMTCKFIQCNLPLTELEFKDVESWNFANRVQIGRGGCGTVFRCDNPKGEGKLAVKIVPKSSVTNMYVWQRVMMEIDIMRLMDHPNIVKFIDAFQTKQDVVIITEFAEGGTLRNAVDYIRKNKLNIESFCGHVMSQLSTALSYMWRVHGIAHRDLKMENIVLSKDYSRVLVIDFGLAEFSKPPPGLQGEDGGIDTFVKNYVPCGTVGYASPENIYAVFAKPSMVRATSLTMHKCDMYSLGVLCWAILTATKLFPDHNFKRIRAVMDQGISCEGIMWSGRTQEAKEACMSLLQRGTTRRVTSEQFLQNPWVLQGALEFKEIQSKITSEMEEEGDWDPADEGWVFMQYGGFVESSWVLLDQEGSQANEATCDVTATQ